MAHKFMETMLTPAVLVAQNQNYGKCAQPLSPQENDQLGAEEVAFIHARDSFYLATINESGWPYVQHRGGPPGFLRVVSPSQIVFSDYPGNRQLLSTGHLSTNNRVALFLMDYPNRERLKILGHARVEIVPPSQTPTTPPQPQAERIFTIDVIGYDWNCPKYITPRFTENELAPVILPLKQRIAELEAQLQAAQTKNAKNP